MINGCMFRHAKLRFHTGEIDQTGNLFTTIVGRNGSGKSRLLRELVNSYANVSEPRRDREIEEFRSLYDLDGRRPENIIASSTSPFDKFPIRESIEVNDGYYFYQGLRDLGSSNLSLAFMSRTLSFLIKAISYDSDRVGTVMDVLGYLGYRNYITATYTLDVSRKLSNEILKSEHPEQYLNEIMSERSGRNTMDGQRFFFKLLSARMEGKLLLVLNALKIFFEMHEKPRIDIIVTSSGAIDLINGRLLDETFSILLEAGLLRLRDVTLHKNDVQIPFRINDASSGEQCIVMGLVGIAAHIKDGSLICIDEPEICLHPEWQERYIELLMSTFRRFKKCHFIIATHSPQIISNLANSNCFVLDIQHGKTYNARDFNNRSADFQLAKIFGAPGFKNEYLTREILSALTVLGSGSQIPEKKLVELRSFVLFKNSLDGDDPVKSLLTMLEEALGALDE